MQLISYIIGKQEFQWKYLDREVNFPWNSVTNILTDIGTELDI